MRLSYRPPIINIHKLPQYLTSRPRYLYTYIYKYQASLNRGMLMKHAATRRTSASAYKKSRIAIAIRHYSLPPFFARMSRLTLVCEHIPIYTYTQSAVCSTASARVSTSSRMYIYHHASSGRSAVWNYGTSLAAKSRSSSSSSSGGGGCRARHSCNGLNDGINAIHEGLPSPPSRHSSRRVHIYASEKERRESQGTQLRAIVWA